MTAFWQAKAESKDAEKPAKSSNRSHPDVNALRCGPTRYDRHLSQHPDATDLKQAPRKIISLMLGESVWWESRIEVKMNDGPLAISYTRAENALVSSAALLGVGSVFYPLVAIIILLSIIMVGILIMVGGRSMSMFYLDRVTENSAKEFTPGTLFGIVFGIVAALGKLVGELFSVFAGFQK